MSDRFSEPPESCGNPISGIEISFAMPVFFRDVDYEILDMVLDRIVAAPWNQTPEGPHWMAGCGSKPNWSKADCRFLGKPIDPEAPDSGEPEFDDSCYAIETAARPWNDEEERAKSARTKAKYSRARADHHIAILRAKIAEIEAEENL